MSIRDCIAGLSRGPMALPVSVLLGFLEGTFVIVAMEPLFIPLMAARGKRAWVIAACLLAGNVLGGLFMYAAGAYFAGPELASFITGGNLQESFDSLMQRLEGNGFLVLFAIGVTPFPFQVGTTAAGAFGYPIGLFVLAVALSRAIRYFGLGILVSVIGARAREWLEEHEIEIFLAGAAIFVLLSAYVLIV